MVRSRTAARGTWCVLAACRCWRTATGTAGTRLTRSPFPSLDRTWAGWRRRTTCSSWGCCNPTRTSRKWIRRLLRCHRQQRRYCFRPPQWSRPPKTAIPRPTTCVPPTRTACRNCCSRVSCSTCRRRAPQPLTCDAASSAPRSAPPRWWVRLLSPASSLACASETSIRDPTVLNTT